MNIKKAAVYLFGGLYLVVFSSACCGPHAEPHPEDPKGPVQEQQTDAAGAPAPAPAVSEETAPAPAAEEVVVGEATMEMAGPAAGEEGAVLEEGAAAEESAAPAAEGEVVEEAVEEAPAAQ